MKTAAPLAPPLIVEPREADDTCPSLGAKLAGLIALTKPRIAVMVLLTVAVGFVLGARGSANPAAMLTLLPTLIGVALVAGGASAWNQYLERFRDAKMRRTANRPLPLGTVAPVEAALFGTALGLIGVTILALSTQPIAAAVALVTFLLYAFVYTPLKPITTLNTAVGAVPGALPPVIGWAAATGNLGIGAWSLFLVVFLWQFPHFLAIAWLYREDYARGGHRMLPNVDPYGDITGRQAARYALALIPAGLLPTVLGLTGMLYFGGALALGVFYLAFATRFWFDVNDATARRLLRASFLYLPAVLLLLLLNPMPV